MIHWNSWWDVIIGLAGSVTLGIQYPSKLSVVYICCLEALCLVSTNLRVKYLPPECMAVFPVKLCLPAVCCRAEPPRVHFEFSVNWNTFSCLTALTVQLLTLLLFKKNLLCLQKELTVWSLTESFRTAAEWSLYSNETQKLSKYGHNFILTLFCVF